MSTAPVRSVTSARPRFGGGPSYAPQRDLAYIYAPALKEALWALDEVNWTPEIRSLIEQAGVTEAQLGLAARSLAEAHNKFLDGTVTDAHQALTAAGWYEHPLIIRYLIYARLGEVILGGFFIALRDVTFMGGEPPQATDIADFIAAGRFILEREHGPNRAPTDGEQLQMKILSLTDELRSAREARSVLEREFRKQASELARVQTQFIYTVPLWRLGGLLIKRGLRFLRIIRK